MKLVVMVLAIACTAIGAAACDSDDDGNPPREELTLADYFGELEDIQNDTQSRFDELAPDVDADASVEEGREAINEFFDELRAVVEDFVEELEDLDPPEDAEQLHEDAVEASNAFLAALDESIEEIEDFDSILDLIDLDVPDFDEATERFDGACRDLQELAAEREIDVDLGCD